MVKVNEAVVGMTREELDRLRPKPPRPLRHSGTDPARHEIPERNRILNLCMVDLERIIDQHDPEIHHLQNRIWDRLDKMACEIEARIEQPEGE